MSLQKTSSRKPQTNTEYLTTPHRSHRTPPNRTTRTAPHIGTYPFETPPPRDPSPQKAVDSAGTSGRLPGGFQAPQPPAPNGLPKATTGPPQDRDLSNVMVGSNSADHKIWRPDKPPENPDQNCAKKPPTTTPIPLTAQGHTSKWLTAPRSQVVNGIKNQYATLPVFLALFLFLLSLLFFVHFSISKTNDQER